MFQQPLSLPKTYHVRPLWGVLLVAPYIILAAILTFQLFSNISTANTLNNELNALGESPDPTIYFWISLEAIFLGIFVILSIYRIVKLPSFRLELLPQGIAFYTYGYKMFTPWSYIAGIGTQTRGLASLKGLQLWRPALRDRSLADGIMQGVPVMETSWYLKWWGKNYTGLIPIPVGLQPRNFEQSEFGAYLRQYAPQAFRGQMAVPGQ